MALTWTYTAGTPHAVTLTGTGTGTCALFKTADTAGAATYLLTNGVRSKTLSLTYAVRPVEFRAIVLKFIVAAKTAETDYIFITGTDAWDAAQTEAIDVTAGNGSYTSTKRWRTITASGISCSDAADGTGTLWADGNLSVTQDIWGVIWDNGNNQYQIDCKLTIGNASDATTFTETAKQIVFSADKYFIVTANATATFGTKIDANTARDGCMILMNDSDGSNTTITFNGTLNLYDTSWLVFGTSSGWLRDTYTMNTGMTTEFIQCFIQVGSIFKFLNSTNTTSNVYFANCWNGLSVTAAITMTNLKMRNSLGRILNFGTATPINLVTCDCGQAGSGSDFYVVTANLVINFLDCTVARWTFSFTGTGQTINENYTCNINVCDKNGTAISGATVDCVDTAAAAVWSAGTVTTDASGNITQQTIPYRVRTNDGAGNTVITTKSPHRFTFTKAGYQTLVMENITVSAPIKWHVEMNPSVVMSRVRSGN